MLINFIILPFAYIFLIIVFFWDVFAFAADAVSSSGLRVAIASGVMDVHYFQKCTFFVFFDGYFFFLQEVLTSFCFLFKILTRFCNFSVLY
jgi:hypothetical protein